MQPCFLIPTPQDLDEFVSISVKTCRETFAADNDPLAFESYLSTAFAPERLRRLLEDPHYHVWLLRCPSVAGYFALRDEPCPYSVIPGQHPVEIERFYMDRAYQGAGFGKQMMAFCLDQAQALGADSVWLGVWEQNTKAQQFYQKQGFQRVGRHDYWVGSDCQNHLLMQKTISY